MKEGEIKKKKRILDVEIFTEDGQSEMISLQNFDIVGGERKFNEEAEKLIDDTKNLLKEKWFDNFPEMEVFKLSDLGQIGGEPKEVFVVCSAITKIVVKLKEF